MEQMNSSINMVTLDLGAEPSFIAAAQDVYDRVKLEFTHGRHLPDLRCIKIGHVEIRPDRRVPPGHWYPVTVV